MSVWIVYLILFNYGRWELAYSTATDVHILPAYVGRIFNASIMMHDKTTLPNWIYWNNKTLIGLPLEVNNGEKLLFSSIDGQKYMIKVNYPNPWWNNLIVPEGNDIHNYEYQMFLAAFIVDRDFFISLSIQDKINIILKIKNIMSINQPVVVIPFQSISKSITFVTKSASTISSENSLVLLWIIGKDYIFNSSLKALQTFESKFSNGPVKIDQIVIQQWFVGFLQHQRKFSKIYYRRSINNPELVALIEGSGSWQMRKANEFIKRTKDVVNVTETFISNHTSSGSKPSIMSLLLPIKMHALQIMNYAIPENSFKDKEFRSSLKIKVFFGDDKIVVNDPTKWISYNQNDQNIRLNPKLTDVGETILKICAYNLLGGFVCQNLSISVSPPPPQNHQIYVSKFHKDYIIKYVIPLAWFKRFGVRKREDILIVNATGNSPFDWNGNGHLEILDVASIEGKLIEINLLTLIKNESQIYIHLTLPVVAINKQKLTTGPLYRSAFKFRDEHQVDRKAMFNLTDTCKLLKELENYVAKALLFPKIKIQIFSPLKSPLFFDKKHGNKHNLLIFDWFFYNDVSIPSFCMNSKINTIDQELLFRSFGSFFMVNMTILENRFGSICSFNADLNSVTKESSDIQETVINTTPSVVDKKIAAESEIINKTFPNFQYTHFTVTAGLPFKSYILRRTSIEESNIKEMRLEASSGMESEPWIALSASNNFLYGLPLKKHVRESAYKFRFIIKLANSQTQFKVTFQVNVVQFDLTTVNINHKIKLYVKIENIQINMHYRWKLVTQLDKYVRDTCEGSNDCGKDMILWNVDPVQTTENQISASISIEISYLSLMFKSTPYCPKLSLIRFFDKFINTANNNKETMPNLTLKYLFSTSGLGELIGSQIILFGTCEGVRLQPPDLGQITVYSMIPFYQSLRQLKIFYNSTVWFSINSGNPSKDKMVFHEWISVNEDSTALVGLALHRHAKADPYLVELVVHSKAIRHVISPRIAVRVRRLKEHQLFIPFLQQLNHQITVNIHPMARINPKKNFLLYKFLFSSLTDQYFRPDCIKNDYTRTSLPFPPCGVNVVYQSITNSENADIITFKFSLIRELTFVKPVDSTPFTALSGYGRFCPTDQLSKIERSLIGDSGFPNKFGVLPRVNEYFDKSNIGKIVDIKFEYLGVCEQHQFASIPRKDALEETHRKVSATNLKKINDDSRQMFLMATIVPTCSFIIISLCVGLMVACCLQKRNQKFILSINSHLSSAEFAMQGGTPPIILAGEYQHSYMPPSRPLILPHEKPPVCPPDYIAENNSVLINDEEA